MKNLSHDPLLLTVAFLLALALMLLVALIWLAWVRRIDISQVPCGAYGICQHRADCTDHHCEGHPAQQRGSAQVIQLQRRRCEPPPHPLGDHSDKA